MAANSRPIWVTTGLTSGYFHHMSSEPRVEDRDLSQSYPARRETTDCWDSQHSESRILDKGNSASFEKEVECCVCRDLFKDPRFLACNHTLCFRCISRLMDYGKSSLLCPLCRKKTKIPISGANGLAKNGLAEMIVDFVTEHRPADKEIGIACQSQHEMRQTAEFFCHTCKCAICGSCGMKYHREDSKHHTTPINKVVRMMKDNLGDLLAWGINRESEQGKLQQQLERIIEQEVSTKFKAVKTAIDETFGEERKLLDDRKRNVEQQLQDMKASIETALQKQCGITVKEKMSIAELNYLTEDILVGSDSALIEKHDEITSGYQSQKQNALPTTLPTSSGSLQHLSGFISTIKFQQDPTKKGVVGRIMSNTGHWMLIQTRFPSGTDSKGNPSSIIELSNGLLAVGFSVERDIEIFEKSCQRSNSHDSRSVRTMCAVKDLAPLSNNSLLVLNEFGDVSRVCKRKQNIIFGQDTSEDDNPCLIAANNNSFFLLNGDRVNSYSLKECLHERSIDLSLRVDDKPLRMQIRGNSGSDVSSYLEILIVNGKSVRTVHCSMSPWSQRIVISETSLDKQVRIHGRNVGHAADEEGSLFIAYTKDNRLITIRKYVGGDLSKEETVICGLEVMMDGDDDDDIISLAALSPTCLVMCTSQKLSVFNKVTVQEFARKIIQ